ncbi:MAG: glycosyltransferase [Dehalococcoidaceae bacterium]|nr:glycosyltransferase [Dehalococcoidaceae bacterium]
MGYQLLIGSLLILVLINLVMNLYFLKTAQQKLGCEDIPDLVSVLIPARNEEANIGSCLESLIRQNCTNLEIIVLDDNSTDKTAGVVRRFCQQDPRIRLIKGKPLEKDWAGKPFACQQLADEASGQWLLFVDADTIHAPEMIGSTLKLACQTGADLMSGMPRQLGSSLPQKIAIPVLYFIIMAWLPVWYLQSSKGNPRPCVAIGQFMLFKSEFYREIGGHESVKNRIIEDVWLAVETVRHGGRYILADLSQVVFCNMYSNIRDMWNGFIKWMYSVASLSIWALAGLMLAGYILFFAPFLSLWNQMFVLNIPSPWFFIVVFQVVIIILMRLMVDIRFKEPVVSALLHPFGFVFLFASCISAIIKIASGNGVAWKERIYDHDSPVK